MEIIDDRLLRFDVTTTILWSCSHYNIRTWNICAYGYDNILEIHQFLFHLLVKPFPTKFTNIIYLIVIYHKFNQFNIHFVIFLNFSIFDSIIDSYLLISLLLKCLHIDLSMSHFFNYMIILIQSFLTLFFFLLIFHLFHI